MRAAIGRSRADFTVALLATSYNKSVLDAERSAQRFTASGGTGVVLRFGGLYGPDALLAEMLNMMRKGISPVPGDPSAFLSSLSQDDAATAVVAALGVPAGTYNIVEDEPMRRGDWTRSLAIRGGHPRAKADPRVDDGDRWVDAQVHGAVGAGLEPEVQGRVGVGAELSEGVGRMG